MIGRIHSYETCGTVDGPGIRFVLFMQGCPMRCLYCHNPDTWMMKDGKDMDTDALIQEIKKYRSYMKFSGGGLTISGGEPLMQWEFVTELVLKAKALGIHTTLDTSGCLFTEAMKPLFAAVDLVLLDIKEFNPVRYQTLTSFELGPTLDLMDYLQSIDKKIWIRYVFVPGYTDATEDLVDLAKYLGDFTNILKVEILSFHKMGEYKWQALGYDYQLTDVKEPKQEALLEAKAIFEKEGLVTYINA